MSTNHVPQHTLSPQLVEAGERLNSATTEADRHRAAVDLLRLRLIYFTGRAEGPFRGPELDELCAKLTSADLRAITDWCWGSYSGGMESMKQTFDGRTRR